MNYKIYTSNYIIENQGEIISACSRAFSKFQRLFPGSNSTSTTTLMEHKTYKSHDGYRKYNIFSISAPNTYFYNIYCDLIRFIHHFAGLKKFYIQAWINYQASNEVLDWHKHEGYDYHGYISIKPKNTITEFETFKVNNKPGEVFICNGSPRHRVVNLSNFHDKRITIGFDVIFPHKAMVKNSGFIPVYIP